MIDATLRRLCPEPGETSAAEALAALGLADRAPAGRPYLVLNMVASLDGRATSEGRVGALTSPADQAVLYHLRTQADALLVGAGTARTERYGSLLPDPKLRDKRRHEGLPEQPLCAIVSARLDIPPDLPLLDEEDARVAVLTSAAGELPATRARLEHIRGEAAADGRMALAPLLSALRERHGVRSVVCEGGPTLNTALFAEGLVDELFLAIAPKVVGGTIEAPIVGAAAGADVADAELVWALEAEGYLFLRYRFPPPTPGTAG